MWLSLTQILHYGRGLKLDENKISLWKNKRSLKAPLEWVSLMPWQHPKEMLRVQHSCHIKNSWDFGILYFFTEILKHLKNESFLVKSIKFGILGSKNFPGPIFTPLACLKHEICQNWLLSRSQNMSRNPDILKYWKWHIFWTAWPFWLKFLEIA